MSRIIAAYDLDEDHGRLWVNADLKRMPEVVIVANEPMDRAQTVTYVPESQTENDELRELVRDMWLQLLNAYDRKEVDEFADRMRELGVEAEA